MLQAAHNLEYFPRTPLLCSAATRKCPPRIATRNATRRRAGPAAYPAMLGCLQPVLPLNTPNRGDCKRPPATTPLPDGPRNGRIAWMPPEAYGGGSGKATCRSDLTHLHSALASVGVGGGSFYYSGKLLFMPATQAGAADLFLHGLFRLPLPCFLLGHLHTHIRLECRCARRPRGILPKPPERSAFSSGGVTSSFFRSSAISALSFVTPRLPIFGEIRTKGRGGRRDTRAARTNYLPARKKKRQAFGTQATEGLGGYVYNSRNGSPRSHAKTPSMATDHPANSRLSHMAP